MNKGVKLILVCVGCVSLVVATAGASTNVLEVFNDDFGTTPSTHVDPTINIGDTVQWVWSSGSIPHSTTAAAGQLENWDSGIHTTPFSFDHTFTHAGTFNYFCAVHGFDAGGGQVGGMSGHVIVTGPPSELSVTKSVIPGSVSVGGTLTFTIVVANNSATNATNVMLTDALPDTATFVSTDTTQGSCTQIAGVVTCDLGSLDASSVATVTMVVTASTKGSACNSATVTGVLGDSLSTNTSAPACAVVQEHNLAVIAVKVPKTISLTTAKPSQTKFVRVTIQNRSEHMEMVMDTGVLSNLVTLSLESVGTNCAAPVATLVIGRPQKPLPVMLKPKQKFTAVFNVTYDCANDPLKGAGHEDYRYLASVHHEAIDNQPDSDQDDDACPRDALGGSFKDKGCGSKKSDGTLGAPVSTDVTLK
jgi:uncharacterized repeat protein (TIGR01451 family)